MGYWRHTYRYMRLEKFEFWESQGNIMKEFEDWMAQDGG